MGRVPKGTRTPHPSRLVKEFELHVPQRVIISSPEPNVIELFTEVSYRHSMVIPSFCVIKLYYLGNCHGMTVIYHGIKLFYNIGEKSLL